jgi:MFS family permease
MLAEAAAALGLGIASALGVISEVVIFALIFVVGAARAFQMPTMQALLPALVPPQLLSRAIAANASAGQTAIIAGPALGGIIYVAGPATVYAVSTALFVLTGLMIFLIRIERRRAPASAPGLSSVLEGIRFIRRQPAVLGAISLDMFAVLLGGATALLPIYARDILQAGPLGLGILRAAPAVGALLMTIALARHSINRHVGLRMFQAVIVFGAATVVFALSQWMWLSVLALALLGAADTISVVIRFSLVQLSTPDEMRGRVGAVNFLFINASNQLGQFESGVTAALLGTVPAAVLGGVGTIAIALLWMKLFPALRKVERLE